MKGITYLILWVLSIITFFTLCAVIDGATTHKTYTECKMNDDSLYIEFNTTTQSIDCYRYTMGDTFGFATETGMLFLCLTSLGAIVLLPAVYMFGDE